jgi:hypothetical protein
MCGGGGKQSIHIKVEKWRRPNFEKSEKKKPQHFSKLAVDFEKAVKKLDNAERYTVSRHLQSHKYELCCSFY